MTRISLLIEWEEGPALELAEAVWNAGGTVRICAEPVHEHQDLSLPDPWAEPQRVGA